MIEGFMEVELLVTKRDDDRPTNRVNIEQSASGRLEGRVLQKRFSSLDPFPSLKSKESVVASSLVERGTSAVDSERHN